MCEPDSMWLLVDQARDRGDRDLMMLVVVGQKREHRVTVNDLGAEDGDVPIDHRLELLGGEHSMRKICGRPASASVFVIARLCRHRDLSFAGRRSETASCC